MGEQMNPCSKKRKRQHDHIDQKNGGFRIEYEEAYFDMGKEFVVERMKDRRRNRVRERDEANTFQRRNGLGVENDAENVGCVVM